MTQTPRQAASPRVDPTTSAHAAHTGSKPPVHRELLDVALATHLVPRSYSALQWLSMLILGASAIALIGVYVALVFGTAAATFWHATTHYAWLLTPTGAYLIAPYAFGVIVGLVTVALLLRPLLVRVPNDDTTRALNPNKEALLIHFLERISRSVDARAPAQVRISWRPIIVTEYPTITSIFSQRYVLTVGLPLLASCSTRQFAMLVASELARRSCRFPYRIAALLENVLGFFQRCGYASDTLDRHLEIQFKTAKNFSAAGLLASHIVLNAGRLPFRTLSAISAFLFNDYLKRIELNINRYATLLCGTAEAENALRHWQALILEQENVENEAVYRWRYGEQITDLSQALIMGARKRLAKTPDLENHVASDDAPTSTPSLRERLAAVRLGPRDGYILFDFPAHQLVQDMPNLSLWMSRNYYASPTFQATQPVQNDKKTFDEYRASVKRGRASHTLQSYFLGNFTSNRFIVPEVPVTNGPIDRGVAKMTLGLIREKLDTNAATYQAYLRELARGSRTLNTANAERGLWEYEKLLAKRMGIALRLFLDTARESERTLVGLHLDSLRALNELKPWANMLEYYARSWHDIASRGELTAEQRAAVGKLSKKYAAAFKNAVGTLANARFAFKDGDLSTNVIHHFFPNGALAVQSRDLRHALSVCRTANERMQQTYCDIMLSLTGYANAAERAVFAENQQRAASVIPLRSARLAPRPGIFAGAVSGH